MCALACCAREPQVGAESCLGGNRPAHPQRDGSPLSQAFVRSQDDQNLVKCCKSRKPSPLPSPKGRGGSFSWWEKVRMRASSEFTLPTSFLKPLVKRLTRPGRR